uniref:C2 domain-containing protein n=2 Tax=Vitrella brassicaformis TaxID=1169539 RepID=A0A7S1JIS9_9ALVE|mmetsp:Transcript_10263/g.24828  ORF Transcript_10263/g.24828 Transcript_10263/m.24828 type:complete len:283 (+) Transcript_10263:127-975(+)
MPLEKSSGTSRPGSGLPTAAAPTPTLPRKSVPAATKKSTTGSASTLQPAKEAPSPRESDFASPVSMSRTVSMQKSIQNKMDGLLTVEVRNATNIPYDDNDRKFDPYVKLTLGKIELAKLPHATGLMAEQQRPSDGNVGPYRGWFYSAQSIIKRAPKSHVKKTRKIASSDSPEWDEVFEFHITDGANDIIFAEVIDHNVLRANNKLAWFQVPLLALLPIDSWPDEAKDTLADHFNDASDLMPQCEESDAKGFPTMWTVQPADRYDVSETRVSVRFKFQRFVNA